MTGKAYSSVSVLDTDIPHDEVLDVLAGLIPDAAAAEFCDWLAPEVGRFRMMEVAPPPRKEQIKALTDYAKSLQNVIQRMEHEGLPGFARALIDESMYSLYREHAFDAEQATLQYLYRLTAAAQHAQTQLEQWKQPRGQRSQHRRDALLARVVEQLYIIGAPRDEHYNVREAAVEILAACALPGRDLPEHPERQQRAVQRGKRN